MQSERSALDELEALSRELVERHVYDMPQARFSMDALRVGWEAIQATLCRARDRCNAAQTMRKFDGLNDAERADYRAAFERHDVDRAGLNGEQVRRAFASFRCGG